MENAKKANTSKAGELETKRETLNQLHAQQQKLSELQSELDVIEAKVKNNEKLTKEETKFIGELGWLSAAAVAIASLAASV